MTKLALYTSSNPELQLILDVCRTRLRGNVLLSNSPDLKSFRWEKFVKLAEQHKIFPAVYTGIKSSLLEVPPTILVDMKSKYDQKVLRSMQLTQNLALISEAFKKNTLDFYILKGPFLSYQLYGNFTSRQFSDLDLFVEPDHFQSAVAVLSSLGYKGGEFYNQMNSIQKRYYMNHFSDYSMRSPITNILVELHWKIFPKKLINSDFEETIFQESLSLTIGEQVIKGMKLTNHLFYLTIHGYKHSWYRLSWLWDVANAFQLINQDEQKELFKMAVSQKLEVPVIQSICLCNSIMGTNIQTELKKHIKASILHFAEKSIETGKQTWTFSHMIKNYFYLAKMKRSLSYKISILMPYLTHFRDWKVIRLPAILFPVYFILRPFILIYRRISKICT